MGYSPTEYAEFTEPPTEMSSHGFHRFTQMLRVRCSPTEYRIWQRGYGRDAIPSYICAHLCHLWEVLLCQKFPCVPCVLWEYLFSHGFHRATQMLRVRCSPTEYRICQRGYGRDAIPSYICEHPCHLWEVLLCKRFCVFGAFRGSFFTACSVGAAETAAPPGGIHGSSVQISPPHISPSISPQTLPSACPPSTVGTTSSPPAAR